MREHTADYYQEIKAKTRLLIKLCGGLETAASLTSCEKSSLGNAQNPDHPRFLQADEIADLEAFAGRPLVSEVLARASGGDESEVRRGGSTVDAQTLLGAGAQILSDFHAFQECAAESLREDNRVDDDELEALIKEAQDLLITATRNHDWLCNVRASRALKVSPLKRRAG